MRFSEARVRKVVSTSTAAKVGKVEGFVVDPRARAVLALELRKTTSGEVLRWADVEAFGTDDVTVVTDDAITEAGEQVTALLGKDHRLVGKRVLSTAGDELGTVDDVEFEPSSGAVTLLVLDHGEVAGVRLRGVGSYAVVVTAE
jgi:sporulation protein YlmC with PRC-barrel domain